LVVKSAASREAAAEELMVTITNFHEQPAGAGSAGDQVRAREDFTPALPRLAAPPAPG
jgi:hypothetical protein